MKTFFTSDTHYDHANIIKYSNRPFKDVQEMNYEMIRRWNSVVGPDDTVYHLGDFGFGRDNDKHSTQLMGANKYIILGNHDKNPPRGFVRKEQCTEIYLDNKVKVILCHYAMRVWNKSHHGSIMLYGHSHGSLPGNSQSCDVGVDCWDYYPVTFEQIQRKLKASPEWFPVDHHGKH